MIAAQEWAAFLWVREEMPGRAEVGDGGGVEKGVENWLAPSNLVRTARNILKINTVPKD